MKLRSCCCIIATWLYGYISIKESKLVNEASWFWAWANPVSIFFKSAKILTFIFRRKTFIDKTMVFEMRQEQSVRQNILDKTYHF